MIEFGKTLRASREAKGYTVTQLAELTHLPPTRITDLENENFEKIAAPIYGRGFIKLYCETTGIDPKPLIDEYMAIHNGERDDFIRERTPPAPAEPPAEPVEPPAAPANQDNDVFASPGFSAEPPAAPVAEPPAAPVEPAAAPADNEIASPALSAEPPPPVQTDLFGNVIAPPERSVHRHPETEIPRAEPPPPQPEPRFSRYSTPFEQTQARVAEFSSSYWRFGAIILAAIAAFVLILLGVRALYQATSSTAKAEEEARSIPPAVAFKEPKAGKPQPAATKPSAAKAKPPAANQKPPAAKPSNGKRTPQKIPSLYLD